jgi:protein-ribulosamine 3-kinase
VHFQRVGGGSINASWRVTDRSGGAWFAKVNKVSAFPGLFEKEQRGLALLERQGIIRVPSVVGVAAKEDCQVLVLEWIEEGPRTEGFWRSFGEQLARLHGVSNSHFGLDEDNYTGALPQANGGLSSWTEFFVQRRLAPQLSLAARNVLVDRGVIEGFERLYRVLPGIFPEEAPALSHGDLWSGNFLCDAESRPVLIDPAVYFGHRSMDLSMTTLLGGFDKCFYESYASNHPLPPNYREQWEICNLYPLLVHLNLFGESYQGNILHTIRRF